MLLPRGGLVLVGSLAITLSSCGTDQPSDAPVASTLAVSPSAIAFSDTNPHGKVFLTTNPSGGRLDWEVTAKPTWLQVTPQRGTVSRQIVELALDASALIQLNPAVLTGRLEFVSTGGVAEVTVTGHSLALPKLTVLVPQLQFEEPLDTSSLGVRNSGKGTLVFDVSASQPWITLLADETFLRRGESTLVHVRVDRRPLPAGTTLAHVTVRTTTGSDSVVTPIRVSVASAPRGVLSLSRVGFAVGESNRTVRLHNRGKGHLNWVATPADTWLSVTPASGVLIPGDSVTLAVVVSRVGLPPLAQTTIRVTGNSVDGPVTIPVVVTSTNGFVNGLHVLDHRVVDAEASASAELIVTVSADPNQLHILDALAGTIDHVSLSAPPTCVAVRPDGAYAAVGHDASMTLVDLRTRSIVRQYPVPIDILDLVLPMNGWAYAFPRRDQWTAIHSVRLSNGAVTTEMNHPGIYAGTLGRLHPSGEFIYGSENNISPADHPKFDIRDGPAQLMYDSRYHGDYPMGSNAWISDDGTRLFNRAAHVFTLSSKQADDIVYAGRLGGETILLQWVSDAAQFGRIFAFRDELLGPESTQLYVYDRTTLGFVAFRPLQSFPSGTSTVPAHGKFVFPIRDRAYVLARANGAGGLMQDWGLIVFDRGHIP